VSNSQPARPSGGCYAFFYDIAARLSGSSLAPLRELIAGEARGRVLEIGVGTGANLPFYDWQGLEVLEATDPSPQMLRRAQHWLRRLPSEAREPLKFTQTFAESLPYPDESFDVVVSTLVLCSVEDLDRALAEARRVLRPGGELRVLEHVAANGFEGVAQRIAQPFYGTLSGRCRLRRHTEAALQQAGFELNVRKRTRFGPLFPAFAGVAVKPA
jgi:SAM-dependent methyltransferase